ncbi:hypothetical protein [Chryseobacterium sp. MMS23-Vi53]|uniref:hypothetical protein n=1 Tax=Chryseobacterium sp. MMS23-Vi53 TaxID=3386644 RepID=UPI0039ECB070
MKTIYRCMYVALFIGTLCFSQNKQDSNKQNFAEQFFMDINVYHKLKQYSAKNKILIVDPNKYLTNKELTYNNKDLEIQILPEMKAGFIFLIKKVIINDNLAFVGMWKNDSVTALCFYPVLSEFTPNKWIVEEITTRSIK